MLLSLAVTLAGLGAAAPVPRSPRPAALAPAAPAAVPCTNMVGDGDFESAFSPWSESSIPPLVTLVPGPFPQVMSPVPISECTSSDCPAKLFDLNTGLFGIAARAGPAPESPTPGGAFPCESAGGCTWAWFGGGITSTTSITQVIQVVSQPVPLAGARGSLEFNLWISRADAGTGITDTLRALIGATPVFTATAAEQAAYDPYKLVSVPIFDLGTGSVTTLAFSATTQARQNLLPPIVNFNVDNVRLCVTYFTHLPLVAR